MRILTLAFLLCAGAVQGGMRQASMQPVRMYYGENAFNVPEDFRPVLTFYAPLKSDLVVFGRGSTTATYTRNSIATYLSPSTGLTTQVEANVPRFEQNGYLSEGARTNLLLDSAGFVNTWTKGRMRVPEASDPAIVYPDGTSSTLGFIAEDGTTGGHQIYQGYTSTDAKSQTVSVYAKPAGRTIIFLSIQDSGSKGIWRYYDLSTCAVLSATLNTGSSTHWWEVSSSASKAPSGYCRCVLTSSTATGTGKYAVIGTVAVAGTNSYAGDNSSSLFIWGAQVEDNATFASSYIPTTTGAVARAADVLEYPPLKNVPATPPMTLKARVSNSSGNTAQSIHLDTRDQSGVIGAALAVSSNQPQYFVVTAAGTEVLLGDTTTTLTANVPYLLSGAYAVNDAQLFVGGASKGTDSAVSAVTSAGRLYIGNGKNGAVQAFGGTDSVSLFSSRLSGWELGLIK